MEKTQKKFHYAWIIMIACCMIPFSVLGICSACAGIFYTPVTSDPELVGVTRTGLAMMSSIQYVVMALCLPTAGKITAQSGKNYKWVLVASLSVYTLCFAAMSTFKAMWHWYVAGALMGMAGSFAFYTAVPTLIMNWFRDRVGFAMGFSMAMSGVAGAIFNPLGNSIITNYGWRTGYLVLGLCAFALSVPVIILLVKVKPEEKGLLPYGAEKVQASADAPADALSGVSAKDAMKCVPFYFAVAFGTFFVMCGTVQQHIPGFITSVGFDASAGALTLSVCSIGIIIGKLLMGALNDKLGVVKATACGTVLGAAGLLCIFFAKSAVMLYIGGFLFGFAVAMGTTQAPMMVRTFFGSKEYSQIYSNVTSVSTLFQAFIMTFYAWVYEATNNYGISILLACGFLILGFVSIIIIKATSKSLDKYRT